MIAEQFSVFGRVALFFAVGLFWTSSTALAQQKPLTIESSTMQPSVTLGRPMLTWWDVKIQGSGLVVGRFKFVIKSEGVLFATLETEELTLNGPEQRIRVLLPAIDCPQMIDQLQVDISFQGKRHSGNLGQQILRVPFSTKTVFMGLVGESRIVRKRSPQRDKVIERLKFEHLIPPTKNIRGEADEPEYVKTIFASIDPADFPSEPLAYCGYDVVVLMGEEFRTLRKPQLEALFAWIKAGGSLYVEPNGVLEPYHVDFLRNLTADDRQDLVFQVDPAGKLPPDTVPLDRAAVAIKCGLGDAILRTDDPDREIEATTDAWLAIVGPLWKSRFEPTGKPALVYQVVGLDGQLTQATAPNPDPWGFSMALFNRISLRPGELLDRLMPEGVRMVPLSLLAAILIAFVCLIGPGDYFVLGWLRARKFTWLTFPAATLGVTALTVWLSNSYMTAAETRRALVIQDLGRGGEIVRTNRFELLFVASTHQVATEVEKGMFTSLNTGANFNNAIVGRGANVAFQNGRSVNTPVGPTGIVGGDGQVRTMATQIQGRIPTQFAATQDLAKWTPQVNRVFSIPGSGVSPQIDWSEFDLDQFNLQSMQEHVVPPKLVARVRERFGTQAMVACFGGQEGWASDRSPGWRSTRPSGGEQAAVRYNNSQASLINSGTGNTQVMYEADLFRWIYQASVTPLHQGVFALTKQTTPKGGANCDDLLLLDASDPGAWLLVIIVPEKDDYVVYRKLMRFQDHTIESARRIHPPGPLE